MTIHVDSVRIIAVRRTNLCLLCVCPGHPGFRYQCLIVVEAKELKMFRAMFSSSGLVCILLVVVACGVCLAETVNINPHKIVLNAQGASDDVQANVTL